MAEDKKGNVKKRSHKATYTTDKKKGGYLVRVIGPQAAHFAGRTVPVTRRDDSENEEMLDRLLWSGVDTGTEAQPGTGLPVALYAFKPKPRKEDDEVPF